MPILRPQQPLGAARLLAHTQKTSTTLSRTADLPRTFASSATRRAASSHGHEEDHYDPPGGWLWGVPPGQKPEKEGWENLWYFGFFGSFIVAGIAYAFKPDTRYVAETLVYEQGNEVNLNCSPLGTQRLTP